MTKSQLVEAAAKKLDVPKAEARRILQAIFDPTPVNGLIAMLLSKGEKVTFAKFGTFEVRERKARMGRNPQTGEPIKIPAKRKVAFRAGKQLKELAGKKRK